jgi:hypothetical protein
MAPRDPLPAKRHGTCPCCGRGILPRRSKIVLLPVALIPRELLFDREARRWFWFGPDRFWDGRTRAWAHAACGEREWRNFDQDPERYLERERERRNRHQVGRR